MWAVPDAPDRADALRPWCRELRSANCARIERALKLKIARKQVNKADRSFEPRPIENTLQSRTLSKMAGEVFS